MHTVLCERVSTYMLKAIREAKVPTNWINPNQNYEEAVTVFVRACWIFQCATWACRSWGWRKLICGSYPPEPWIGLRAN